MGGMDQTICLYCKIVFTAHANCRQKFCTKQCRERHWLENNRDHANKRMREYRAARYIKDGMWADSGPKARAMKMWMIEIKNVPCQDCGNKFPTCCMDFDHRVGTTKVYNVGSMFAHHYSRELIESELVKCDLVCSNCHRIRTRDRRTGSGKHRVQRVAEDSSLST